MADAEIESLGPYWETVIHNCNVGRVPTIHTLFECHLSLFVFGGMQCDALVNRSIRVWL